MVNRWGAWLPAAGAVAIVGVVLVLITYGGPDDDVPRATQQPTVAAHETCPLTGREPVDATDAQRTAVAVKVANDPAAYPLFGIEDADLVVEEPIEGGHTRFLAIYHCRDASPVGPIRSARMLDVFFLRPLTRVLAFSGANRRVMNTLDRARIIQVTELGAPRAFDRIIRPGLGAEHTLYADTQRLRRAIGDRVLRPPSSSFAFGTLPPGGRSVSRAVIRYGPGTTIVYRARRGSWVRTQNGRVLETQDATPIVVDNVIVLEYELRYLKSVVDVAGNPSVTIADPTAGGRAFLLRDGRVFAGLWRRSARTDPISLLASGGGAMVLRPGTTWIQVVPSATSEVDGRFFFR